MREEATKGGNKGEREQRREGDRKGVSELGFTRAREQVGREGD